MVPVVPASPLPNMIDLWGLWCWSEFQCMQDGYQFARGPNMSKPTLGLDKEKHEFKSIEAIVARQLEQSQ